MARPIRIQYAGANYHLMCRGDRREAIFRGDSDRELFLRTLAETCARSGMRVHSYVLMENHYHLLAETPEANLVAAMKWLQGTYTQRFNMRHCLSGHLFQGRYKAIPVEGGLGDYFLALSDYIHMNPVRARMFGGGEPKVVDYRWSSCGRFAKEAQLPDWLHREAVFEALGLPDGNAGSRRRYAGLMERRAREVLEVEPDEGKAREWRELRRGWCLGSEGFRDRLMDIAAGLAQGRQRNSYTGEALRMHDEAEAARLLSMGMERMGCAEGEIRTAAHNDPRKQALAWLVRSRTVMESRWVADRLSMGHPSNVSRAVAAFANESDKERRKLRKIMQACKG